LKLFRATPPPIDRRDAGFTIIEVLIALAVVAVSIVAIGSVMSTNVAGARWSKHVTLMADGAFHYDCGDPAARQLASCIVGTGQ